MTEAVRPMTRSCPRCSRAVADEWAFCPFDGSPLDPQHPGHQRAAKLAGFEPRFTRLSGRLLRGRYQIDSYVSKGATAHVYLANDFDNGDVVVVKMFDPSVREREAMRRQFAEEAVALRAIDHPNVVRVFDSGEVDGAPFVVMEALRGQTLGDHLAAVGTLDEREALRIAREAGEGLAAAHRARVVHRDVKPDNLFLVGEQRKVKVIDFGMAKIEGSSEPSTEDLVMGTVQYMAPEQIVSEHVDARTDVYALGVVLFRALTGHLPFDVEHHPDMLGHQLFSPAPPPSWLQDDLDPNVERVILSAMRKNPDNRYPTMDAFLDDLARTVPEGWPLRASPDLYQPVTEIGRTAAQILSDRFGLPPSRP
jgi:serine/threonine protein kinase